ncbi:MAG TPA: Gfo/Idh/MocA family oxidoreductase [Chloroflexota bacterium]|nr:Gfo/Idh/MocA family oxidoreductase [Chloroflexota bacterium]
MKVALIGKRAGSFIAGVRSVQGCAVTAVCEADPAALEALGERAGVGSEGRYLDYETLLERHKPDVVALGTPMQLHVPQAVRALGDGIHVLSEVTAAVDLEQCRDLVRAVRGSGAQYMMAENACYRKPALLVRAMAAQGLFGTPYFGEGEYLHDVKHLHHFADGTPTWRATWQVGKRGCTYGTHSLGPALEFFGPDARVVSVSCVGSGIHTDPEHPHDDTCLMLCQLNVGGLIKVRLDMMSNRPHAQAYYSLQGTKGAYEASRTPGEPDKVWLGGEDANNPRAKREWEPLLNHERYLAGEYDFDAAARAGHGGGDYFVAREFLRAVLDSKRPPIDVYRALDYTVPGLISEQSILQGGTPLPVPDFRALED